MLFQNWVARGGGWVKAAGMDDPVEIYNWLRLDARVTTSGQPEEEQLAALAKIGVRRVINLALHDHEQALADEGRSVAALGMSYTHVPVVWEKPEERDFWAFCSAFEAVPDAKVHVHCIANYRVSAFFYRYRRQMLGWSEGRARADLEKIWRPEGVWAAFVEYAER